MFEPRWTADWLFEIPQIITAHKMTFEPGIVILLSGVADSSLKG
jgi:hypothetical protein